MLKLMFPLTFALPAVLLQHYVYYAGAAFGAEFCRRVVYHFYAVDALGRYLLQYFGAVVAGQSAGFSVYPYFHAGVSAQRYVAVGVDLYRRDVLQHVGGGHACVAYVLRHVERLAVNLKPHAGPLRRHGDLFQRLAVLGHVHVVEVFVLVLFAQSEVAAHLRVADVRQLEGIVAVGQLPDVELPLVVGHRACYEFLGGTVEY